MAVAILLTAERARASGTDAGNMAMRRAGRTRWSREDANRAAAVTNRLLLSVPFEKGGLGGLTFTHAMMDDLGVTAEQVIAAGNRIAGHNGGPLLAA